MIMTCLPAGLWQSLLFSTRSCLQLRDVNFREFHFSIREFQSSSLVEYSKVTWQLAWMMHLMSECCNSVDITPRGCGWAATPGKWSDGRKAVAVSNYKARPSLSCTRVLSDPTDRPLSSHSSHAVAVIAQPHSRWHVGACVQFSKS